VRGEPSAALPLPPLRLMQCSKQLGTWKSLPSDFSVLKKTGNSECSFFRSDWEHLFWRTSNSEFPVGNSGIFLEVRLSNLKITDFIFLTKFNFSQIPSYIESTMTIRCRYHQCSKIKKLIILINAPQCLASATPTDLFCYQGSIFEI
jgi:hypothetical protein